MRAPQFQTTSPYLPEQPGYFPRFLEERLERYDIRLSRMRGNTHEQIKEAEVLRELRIERLLKKLGRIEYQMENPLTFSQSRFLIRQAEELIWRARELAAIDIAETWYFNREAETDDFLWTVLDRKSPLFPTVEAGISTSAPDFDSKAGDVLPAAPPTFESSITPLAFLRSLLRSPEKACEKSVSLRFLNTCILITGCSFVFGMLITVILLLPILEPARRPAIRVIPSTVPASGTGPVSPDFLPTRPEGERTP